MKLFVAVAVIGLAIMACEVNVSTANFADAYMAADAEGTQHTSTYGPYDIFYAVVDLANAPDDTEVKAVWTAIEVDPQDVSGTQINETSILSGDGIVFFNLENNPEFYWPSGTYQVELYLNGALETTLDFSVQ